MIRVLRAIIEVFFITLTYFSGIGLLVYGGITGYSWAHNIGLPLMLIGAIPVAYKFAKSDPRWKN